MSESLHLTHPQICIECMIEYPKGTPGRMDYEGEFTCASCCWKKSDYEPCSYTGDSLSPLRTHNIEVAVNNYTCDVCGKTLQKGDWGIFAAGIKHISCFTGHLPTFIREWADLQESSPIKPMTPHQQQILSFGFKFGAPKKAVGTRIIDCRKLQNPYNDPTLRPLNGKDERVQKAVIKCFKAKHLLQSAEMWYRAGYSISFGCHGGNHRSVAMAEMLAQKVGCSNLNHLHLKVKGAQG